jgi:hypothetical protein
VPCDDEWGGHTSSRQIVKTISPTSQEEIDSVDNGRDWAALGQMKRLRGLDRRCFGTPSVSTAVARSRDNPQHNHD